MTALIAATVLLVVAYMGLVAGLRSFARWAINREAERTAAATFECDFIPQAHEVADADTTAIVEEIVAVLDDCTAHVERLLFAAEIAELEDAS